jgi:O-acetyl-ADP-ribose deacetylase (regulator of RNase III)
MNKFILIDRNQEMVDAWKEEFKEYENVETHCGDIFEKSADFLVSPSNSFGFMDGGIDLAYSKKIGWHLQETLQDKIKNEFDGELLIGQSCTVDTNFEQYPKMIAAPTMRVPMYLDGTPNVYLAAKAVFLAVKRSGEDKSCAIPGLGTGTGHVSFALCAQKMRMAYEDWFLEKATFPSKLFRANLKHLEELT